MARNKIKKAIINVYNNNNTTSASTNAVADTASSATSSASTASDVITTGIGGQDAPHGPVVVNGAGAAAKTAKTAVKKAVEKTPAATPDTPDVTTPAVPSGDGLSWFAINWKTIAIAAGTTAIILAIAKLVRGLNNSIKVRYNKVVKTLLRAQKDFTLNEDGLNMSKVLPGVGSKIGDFFASLWTWNFKSKNNKKGNIGLHPFCANYINEIETDFKTSQAAWNKIPLAANESDANKNADRNTDTSVGGVAAATAEKGMNVSTSAYSGKVYSSFREAYYEDHLNEDLNEEELNEAILTSIGMALLPAMIATAGKYMFQRFNKDGQPEGEPKAVQVTKESTREICYAIINTYADKYINMKQVFKQLGINSNSLADISQSDVDKLQKVLEKYSKPEANAYTKQYARIKKAYDNMLTHYYKIGDGIISNFTKYSEAKDEKHSNLIIASKEKLQNMWDTQKDTYDNAFSHVITEIISSEPYIQYLNFIIQDVLPVFKTGQAGDADYVLDILPKKNEYYLLRQTNNGQEVITSGEEAKGNVAVARIEGFDNKTNEIKFKLICLVKGTPGDVYEMGEDGVATLRIESPDSLDFGAYKGHENITIQYPKWMSLDPVLLNWQPESKSNIYVREIKDKRKMYIEYVYAQDIEPNNDGTYTQAYVIIRRNNKPSSGVICKLSEPMSKEDFEKIITKINESSENKFIVDNSADIKLYISQIENKDTKDIKPSDFEEIITNMNLSEEPKKETEVQPGEPSLFIKQNDEEGYNAYVLVNKYEDKDGDKTDEIRYAVYMQGLNHGLIEYKIFKFDSSILTEDVEKTISNKGYELVTKDIISKVDKIVSDESGVASDVDKFTVYKVESLDKVTDMMSAFERNSFMDTKNLDELLKKTSELISKIGNAEGDLLKAFFAFNQEGKNDGLDVGPMYMLKDGPTYAGIKSNTFRVYPTLVLANIDNTQKIIVGYKIVRVKWNGVLDKFTVGDVEWLVGKMKENIQQGKDIFSDAKDKQVNIISTSLDKSNKESGEQSQSQESSSDVNTTKQDTEENPSANSSTSSPEDKPEDPKEFKKAESVNVNYSYEVSVNESLASADIQMTRSFDKRMKNWYILSEVVFDDGMMNESSLDNKLFVNKLNEKSDCTRFAKSSKYVKFMPYEQKQTYTIKSSMNHVPSVSTPMYESIVLVKFGKLDTISEKIVLGKKRIG